MVAQRPQTTYFIHEICWKSLNSQFLDAKLDLDRLMQICRTVSQQPMCWRMFSRFAGVITEAITKVPSPNKSPVRVQVHIWDLEKKAAPFPQTRHLMISARQTHHDPFALLPLELRENIAMSLPTTDYLALRFVSRAMQIVFSSQQFWKSRFHLDGDRGFMNYLLAWKPFVKDWRLIYHCTNTARFYKPYLAARRELWQRNRWIRDMCLMTPAPAMSAWKEDVDIERPNLNHEMLGRGFHGLPSALDRVRSADPLQAQIVFLHPTVVGVGVYLLQERDYTYVVGLEIIYDDMQQENTMLGYRLPGSKIVVDVEARRLTGIQVIVGLYGIHAIKVNPYSVSSRWVGQWMPDGGGMSEARFWEPINVLKGFFAVSGSLLSRVFAYIPYARS
ncbi:uncharacterized protein N7459_009060 [Penicillium hispanicum]|uniref:uncharacterized protein n=1 Tax=Penicillium hispanicum TaxID=1080232 RepID=UPI002540A79C|nr:uncharacterized protein N7459_009060 [Penicillium hispanicum]KAJ5569630.1 hypothetical protein N7459_009060 [Penicillium hispanicum]